MEAPRMTESIYDFRIPSLDGRELALSDFRGRVLLLVNTASQCGFTPQYAGLEQLHRDYGPRGLTVLGFPCNQFGHQEPGDAAEIAQFCQLRYDVTFPLSEKIEVNGDQAHPLFRYLKHEAPGLLGTEGIKWNFTKFLVDRQGRVAARHAPTDTPESLRSEIETLLAEPPPSP
jgi:glutathione peroxidase